MVESSLITRRSTCSLNSFSQYPQFFCTAKNLNSFRDEKERTGQFKGLGSVVSSAGKEAVGRFEQMSAESIQKYLEEGVQRHVCPGEFEI